MNLRSKQKNDDGAPAASQMPKSDQGAWKMEELASFFRKECLALFGVIPSSFMEKGGGPLFRGRR